MAEGRAIHCYRQLFRDELRVALLRLCSYFHQKYTGRVDHVMSAMDYFLRWIRSEDATPPINWPLDNQVAIESILSDRFLSRLEGFESNDIYPGLLECIRIEAHIAVAAVYAPREE